MNPSLQNVDPNLKETYDKVMATQLPQQSSSQPKIIEPTPSAPPAEPKTTEQPKPATAQTSQVFVASPTTQTSSKKAGKGLPPVALGAAALVFFAIYAVVWLKVFGVF